MVRRKIERQVRFNHQRAGEGNENEKWYFLIVDDNRGAEMAQKRIYSLFIPIQEEQAVIDGHYKSTGLRYRVLRFESRKKVELSELRRVHKRVFNDRNLYDRSDGSKGLEVYVANLFN